MQNYNINKYTVGSILNLVKMGDIAIPEIQRPFVWKNKQVRDLIDSLYKGYPVGYLITTQNAQMKLKDGTLSKGRRVLIDGQQRVTALMAAILGMPVLDDEYKERRIKIAFNPLAGEDEDNFEVQDNSHIKSKKWIEDISVVLSSDFDMFNFILKYCEDNSEITTSQMANVIQSLRELLNKDLGVIELSPSLDIDVVTEIFIRINSKGTTLSQADFAMSKIAADDSYGGNMLRKAIDYFCHVAKEPSFFKIIRDQDKEFMDSKYANKVSWLQNNYDDIYDPSYEDMLRVSFIHMFSRGRLRDLVSLLSGRDFLSKEYKEEITEDSFKKLDEGINNFMSQYYFEQFVLAIKDAGFIHSSLLNSQNALDFAYVVYLKMKLSNEVSPTEIKRIVAKWFIMSILTGRYSTSPESVMDKDIRSINEKGVVRYLEEIESSDLSNTFWDITLVQKLESSVVIAPALSVFRACQARSGDHALLSKGLYVRDMIAKSDVHHIFPKAYLRKMGNIDDKTIYNQIANYAYLDTPINIAIGEKAPNEYLSNAIEEIKKGNIVFGNNWTLEEFYNNLKENCIPLDLVNWDYSDYQDKFLPERRKLIAQKIKNYYLSF